MKKIIIILLSSTQVINVIKKVDTNGQHGSLAAHWHSVSVDHDCLELIHKHAM